MNNFFTSSYSCQIKAAFVLKMDSNINYVISGTEHEYPEFYSGTSAIWTVIRAFCQPYIDPGISE